VRLLFKLVIPLALAAAVVVSAVTAQARHQRLEPAPTRALQLHTTSP
jgi:hypothetical protein